jgi:hypothetical protein
MVLGLCSTSGFTFHIDESLSSLNKLSYVHKNEKQHVPTIIEMDLRVFFLFCFVWFFFVILFLFIYSFISFLPLSFRFVHNYASFHRLIYIQMSLVR